MNNADLEVVRQRLEAACELIRRLRQLNQGMRQLKLQDEANHLTGMVQVNVESALYRIEGSFPRPEDVA
jgi:hypothetical protein